MKCAIYPRIKFLIFLLVSLQGFTVIGQPKNHKLAFIIWMPYDNNLNHWADSIYSMVNTGLHSSEIVVAIQKDESGSGGMTRSILTASKQIDEKISEENSASGRVYSDYLEWVRSKITSDKHVFIFLDHGGGLDEIGLDEYPVKGFLRVDSANWAIDRYNQAVGRQAELIYLQVCTKGSIEPVYEFSMSSAFTMFSQTQLGAPNFYYEKFFNRLSHQNLQETDGLDLAKMIHETEDLSMYQSLTCVDNSKFQPFIDEFTDFISRRSEVKDYNKSKLEFINYAEQWYFDLASFFDAVEGIDNTDMLSALDELIAFHSLNPNGSTMKGNCGLSLAAMLHNYPAFIKKYEHLDFFKKAPVADLSEQLREF